MAKIVRKYATTTEAEIRSLTEQGLTFVKIAEKLNLNVQSLRQAASLMGIKSGRLHSETLPLAEWVDALANGSTLQEIADPRAISRQSVYTCLARRGLPTNCRAAVKFKALQASKQQAPVAQLVEQPLCMVQVAGSIPARGSIDGMAA